MISKSFKSFVLSLALVVSFSALSFASSSGTPISKEVDGVKAALTFTNEKVEKGSNDFTISLLDANNQPLTDASLEVTADMDRSTDMGDDGMEKDKPMMIDLKAGTNAGEYTGAADFKAVGKWIINAKFDVQGQAKTVDFDFEVQDAGPNWLLLGGFTGAMVLIIGAAAINKKRSKKTYK